MDFLAIGDTTVDEFIRLKDASVHCDLDHENCTISMRWGDKIPFDFSVAVPGVGNAANAAVAAARLGLSSGLVADIGTDRLGDDIMAYFAKEKLDASFVKRHADIPTNHHFVLWYESERTILIKQNPYPYALPQNLPPPKAIYFSSVGGASEAYHDAIADHLEAHPEILFAFQPGTFQIALGTERLARLYARANLFVCNKEEAEEILKRGPDQEVPDLLRGLAALGPKVSIITDDRNGAYAYDGNAMFFVPMYPDVRPPYERTGAGDAFTSTVAVALTLGKSLEEALLWGPINSMSVVQKVGAQEGLLSRADLETYLKNAPAEYKITRI